MTPEEHWLKLRGIEAPCDVCHGSGVRLYGSTSTWHGGMGGCMMTKDVCDHCWGSGDEHRHWTDLKKLRAEETKRVHERAAELFAHRSGVELKSLHPALEELCTELDKFSRQRRPRPQGFDTVVRCLSGLLRDLVKAKS